MDNIERPMMACGHAANAILHHKDGTKTPCCAICAGLGMGADDVVPTPNLEGRKAFCGYCHKEANSAMHLPFFEYRKNATTDLYYCGCRGWD